MKELLWQALEEFVEEGRTFERLNEINRRDGRVLDPNGREGTSGVGLVFIELDLVHDRVGMLYTLTVRLEPRRKG